MNKVLGIFFLVAAFGIMTYQGKQVAEVEPQQDTVEQAQTEAQSQPEQPKESLTATTGLFESVKQAPVAPKAVTSSSSEQHYTLENELIKATFTSKGGGIRTVELKNYPLTLKSEEPFIFNAYNEEAALGFGFEVERDVVQEYAPEFKVVSQSDDKILLSAKTREGIEILRGYSLAGADSVRDPYLIKHETKFINKSNEAFNLKRLFLSLGSFPPTKGDSFGEYLNAGYYTNDDAEFIKINQFQGSKGFLGFGQRNPVDTIQEGGSPVVWGAIKNQFFASVVTPDEPAVGIFVQKRDLGLAAGEEGLEEGLEAHLIMELGQLQPGQERLLSLESYVGPKEFSRLDKLGKNQDEVMQFGFFGIISKFLLLMMTSVNAFIPNWGLTIIVVTIIIKLVLWPLTAIQVRSSKRMAKIQEPLKELREKYKNNPQKVQTETMKLFKEHGVNPAAGCLPLFIQLPIFLGLYFMLRTSSELRFASFLWINDLSIADTVTYISTFPVNILPLIMALSMFFQMRMTPSPMTDNFQKKLFQMMPFIFLIFCYNFPAGLVLYWTVQNLLTILQQVITNRMEDNYVAPVQESGKKSKKKKRTPRTA